MNETDGNEPIYPVEEELHRRMQRGINIERDRCAAVAENMAKQFVNGEATTIYGAGYQKACEHIAAAIRDGATS